MLTANSNSWGKRYEVLLSAQENITTVYAKSLSPPRLLTDDEVRATLTPNFMYYVGVQAQRADSRHNPNSGLLPYEDQMRICDAVITNIGIKVAREITQLLRPLAEVVQLFPTAPEEGLAETG